MARERLGDILIKAGLLGEADLRRALNEQQRWGGPLGQYLVQMELITEETLVRALSTQYKLPAVALDPPRLNIAVARQIAQEICERNRLICFRADDSKNFLDVAMADPSSLDAVDEVRVATRKNVRPFFAAPSTIDESIKFVFYGDVDGALGGVIDLSPESGMRTDSAASSELLRRAQGGAAALSPPPSPDAAGLRVQVTENASHAARPPTSEMPIERALPRIRTRPTEAVPPADPPALRPTTTGEAFHISMEVPAVDDSVSDIAELRRRVERAEAALARNSALLQFALNSLVAQGALDHADVAALLQDHED